MVLWLYSAEQYRNSTPINEIAEHAALLGFNDEEVDVLCLHGYEFIPEQDLAALKARRFVVRDASALYRSIATRYPNLRRLHPNHFFECFLRWIVLKEYYSGVPILAWDADIFLNEKLSKIHASFAGSTFTSSSTCFAALHDPNWLISYEKALVAYERDPQAYRDSIFNGLRTKRRNASQQFETSFFGPIIAKSLDERIAWDRLFDGTPEEMLVDYLVRDGSLPHHLARPWGNYVVCPQPLLLPLLAWHHPVGAGMPHSVPADGGEAVLSYHDGQYFHAGRPLAFVHFQGALFRACAAHLIQNRYFGTPGFIYDELYCAPARRKGCGVNEGFFSRKREWTQKIENLPDFPALRERLGDPFSERNIARRYLIEPQLIEAMATICLNSPLEPTMGAKDSSEKPEGGRDSVRNEAICLVCCFLPFEGDSLESWLRLHREMDQRGLKLVMLARHMAPALPFPVFQIPLSFKEYAQWFPVAAAAASKSLDPSDDELARIDFERWNGAHSLPATQAGIPVARIVYQAFLDRLKPSCVLVWDDGPAVSSCLRQLCWNQGIPVQVLERGLLPGTLMIERHGMASYSDLRNAWLSDEMVPSPENGNLFEAAREFYLKNKLQKYAQPDFGSGSEVWREKLGTTGKRVVALFGHVDAGTHGAKDSILGRNGNPAFASTAEALRALVSVTRQRNDAMLVFKPHPFDPTDYSKEDLTGAVLVREANIHALIDLADVVAAQFTTIQYETVFYGKPVLALTRSPWWGRDATYEVGHASELAMQLDAAFARRDWGRKETNARTFVVWLLQRFLIAWAPGVPARRGIPEFASYLRRWASDAAGLPSAEIRVRDAIGLLACFGHDYSSEIPAITGEQAFHLMEMLDGARRTKGKAEQAALWDVTIDDRQDRGICLQPPVDLTFRVPTGAGGRFLSAVCVHPLAWDKPGAGGCEFHLRIDSRVVHVVALDPINIPADRHWHELNVAVPERAEGFHEISLEVRPVGGSTAYRWGIWRAPKFSYVNASAPATQPIAVQ